MISFNCPSCGKHYTFSDKFAGRKLVCSACKAENVVPEPEEELRLADEPLTLSPPPSSPPIPPPLPVPPSSFGESHALPIPPPLPVGTGNTVPGSFGKTGNTVPGSEGPSSSFAADADSAILAFVFEEKKKTAETPPTPPPLPVGTTGPGSLDSEEIKPKRGLVYWGSILSMLFLVVGVSVYLTLFVDWKGPDPRPDQAEELRQRGVQAKILANDKDSEAGSLRLQSSEAWSQADKAIDAIVLTVGEIDDRRLDAKEVDSLYAVHKDDAPQAASIEQKKKEIQDSLGAAETRLAELRRQAGESLTTAATAETGVDVALNEVKLLNRESEFYAEQEQKLRNEIEKHPDVRERASLEAFDREKNRIPLDESISLKNDWTENYFRQFAFPEADSERFFAVFDSSRKLVGEKSLRITSLTTKPITILVPEHRNARCDLSGAKFFAFSLRFPEISDQIAIGTTLDSGKIREMRVRFGNSAGYVEFQTISPRYCEALYFDGRGRFVSIEFPLTGNFFWKRTDSVDMTKFERSDDRIDSLLNRSSTNSNDSKAPENTEKTFFSRIDWVELRFFPRSDRTTLWVDGLVMTEKQSREPYDLLRAEQSQAEQRQREVERFKKRRPTVLTPPSPTSPPQKSSEKEPSVEIVEPEDSATSTNTQESEAPFAFPGTDEERLARTLRWALQTAKGQVRVVIGGERISLGSKSKIPAKIDVVEELDVSGYRKLTETDLNLICSLKGLKRLNLARTDLKNSATAKLSVLKSLESLNLAGNALTFESLLALRNLSELTELNLDGIRAPLDGVESLSSLKKLRSLNLARSPLDSPDLVFLITLKGLETLNLSSTRIGDRGIRFLEALSALRTLDLSKTYISDAALAPLSSLKNLQTLNLEETALSDACLEGLGEIRSLEKVSAWKTKITSEGIQRTLGSPWNNRIRLSE